MKLRTSSRPRRGAWSEYWSKISGAASSSMISGFQGLPQNPSNQRPTIALLSCSRDIFDPLSAVNEGVLATDVASLPRGSELLISASCVLIPGLPQMDPRLRGARIGLVRQLFSEPNASRNPSAPGT